MKESKTPLTSAELIRMELGGCPGIVCGDFARSLELQLAEAKQVLLYAEDAVAKGEEGRKLGIVYEECQKENQELAARVVELEKVLNWLDKHKWRNDGNCDINSAYSWNMSVPTGEDYYNPGKELPLLEAIEAAIAKEK